MKKILSLLLVFVMMFAFVSCSAKPDKYEDRLEKEDFEVEVIDDEDDLEELMDSASSSDDVDVDFDGELKWALFASDGKDYVYMYRFEKSSDAKEMMDAAEQLYEDEIADEDVFVELDGKMFIMASSEDALNVALGK